MREDPLRYSEPLVKVYEAIVDELLVALAKHFNVSAMGNTGSFDYEVMMLGKLGAIRKETAAIIARMAAGNEPMVEVAVKAAMLDALEGVEPELKAAAAAGLLTDAPMDMVDGVQAQLLAYSRQAADQLNLVNTVMLDGTLQAYRKGVYQAKNILEQLGAAQEILNAQTGKVIVGSQSLQQAVRAGVAAMHKEGITGFVDRGGHRWSAEAYVRMDVQTTCSNAANQAVMTRNEQYGNDIVWARTNATARPGCYPWQGVLISMGNRELDVEDGDGRVMHVHPVSKTTYGQPDGIWGINCHHGPMNVFIPGLSYVRGEELKPDGETNRRLYELTQEQRKLERELRYAKREAAMLDAAGDREGFEAAALKVQARQEKLRAFVGEHESLRLEGDRVQVFGYNRSVAGKVRGAYRTDLHSRYSGYLGTTKVSDTVARYEAILGNGDKRLLDGFIRAVDKGEIHVLVGIDEYIATARRVEQTLVGLTAVDGTKIEGYATHFIDRVIGQTADYGVNGMRTGVPLEYVKEALLYGVINRVNNSANGMPGVRIDGSFCIVTINPSTRRLVQTAPRR